MHRALRIGNYILWVLLLLMLAGLIVGGIVWLQRDALAERTIRAELEKIGIPVKALTVTAFTTRSMTLENLELGEGGALHARAAVLNFDYDWRSRVLGPFDATLDGVELRAQIQEGTILLGGIEKAWSEVTVTPNRKAIAVTLNGALKVARDASGHYDAALKEGLLTLIQNQKKVLLPLHISATGEGDITKMTAQGNFHDARNNVRGTFKAKHSFAAKTGRITWETKPMRFSPDGLTFAQLSPGFAEGIATISSRLSLSGVVDLKPKRWSVTPKIIVLELPIDTLLAKALGEGTKIKGSVKGQVPIRISKGGDWRIEKSRLINIGPMNIAVDPKSTGNAFDQHPQAELIKSALSNLEVETLTLDVQSTDDKGNVKLDWHFVGRNPDMMNGQPVDLNLAVTTNLRDMWRSLQEVKRATREAEKLLLRKK